MKKMTATNGRRTRPSKNVAILLDIERGLYHTRGPIPRETFASIVGLSPSQVSRVLRFHCGSCEKTHRLQPAETCLHVHALSDDKLHALTTYLWGDDPILHQVMFEWVVREYDRPPGSRVMRLSKMEHAVAARRAAAMLPKEIA